MMSDEKAVKVGDLVYPTEIEDDKYNGCEFKKLHGLGVFKITKSPDPKLEVPDEPMTRGAVVTVEGDDEFIAVRLTGRGDLPYPFIASYSVTGPQGFFSWKNILSHALGRKIIVHKTVDPNEAPSKVATYSEWCKLPKDELRKYKWMDSDKDFWSISAQSGEFEVDGESDGFYALGAEYFPLIRVERID